MSTATIGRNVWLLRRAKGWGQSELARRSGVKRQTLAFIENGKTQDPGMKAMRGLAEAFGLSFDQLDDDETVKDFAIKWLIESRDHKENGSEESDGT